MFMEEIKFNLRKIKKRELRFISVKWGKEDKEEQKMLLLSILPAACCSRFFLSNT